MGIKIYKDENGKTMVTGAPALSYVLWTFGVICLIIGIPITIVNPVVGIINFIIMSLFFYIGRQYCKVERIKVARKVEGVK